MSSNQPCEQDPIMKAILTEYRRKARAEVTKKQTAVIQELKQTKKELAKERKRNRSIAQELKKFDSKKETYKRVGAYLVKEYAKLNQLKSKPIKYLLTANEDYFGTLKTQRDIRKLTGGL